jgi:hypothetical protein
MGLTPPETSVWEAPVLQPFDEELAEWDSWIAHASRGPFSSFRLARLRTRLEWHAKTRRLENAAGQADAILQRVDKIDSILQARGK